MEMDEDSDEIMDLFLATVGTTTAEVLEWTRPPEPVLWEVIDDEIEHYGQQSSPSDCEESTSQGGPDDGAGARANECGVDHTSLPGDRLPSDHECGMDHTSLPGDRLLSEESGMAELAKATARPPGGQHFSPILPFDNGERHVLIYDVGQGTFDESLVTIAADDHVEEQTLAGHIHLGGADLDEGIVTSGSHPTPSLQGDRLHNPAMESDGEVTAGEGDQLPCCANRLPIATTRPPGKSSKPKPNKRHKKREKELQARQQQIEELLHNDDGFLGNHWWVATKLFRAQCCRTMGGCPVHGAGPRGRLEEPPWWEAGLATSSRSR